jgi:hypothetical protein
MISWFFNWAAFLAKVTIYGTILVATGLLVFTIVTGI